MKMSKVILLVSVSCAILFNAKAQTADEVVNKWMNAMGGHDKLKSIRTIHIENEVSFMNNPATNTTWLSNGKGYKSVTDFNDQKIVDCYIANGGWSVNPLAGQPTPVAMPPAQVKMGQLQLEAGGPLLDYASKGGKVEMLGKDNVNGSSVYKILLTTASGQQAGYYISDSSFYILKEVTKINAGGQEFDINLIKTDYRKTPDGFLMPYSTELSFPGLTANFVAKKIEVNKDFDASIFDMPKN
jgi:hypothetical protein